MRKRSLCVVGALSVSESGFGRGSALLIPDDKDDDGADVGGDDGGLSSRQILKRSLSQSCRRKPIEVLADVLSFVSRFSFNGV